MHLPRAILVPPDQGLVADAKRRLVDGMKKERKKSLTKIECILKGIGSIIVGITIL